MKSLENSISKCKSEDYGYSWRIEVWKTPKIISTMEKWVHCFDAVLRNVLSTWKVLESVNPEIWVWISCKFLKTRGMKISRKSYTMEELNGPLLCGAKISGQLSAMCANVPESASPEGAKWKFLSAFIVVATSGSVRGMILQISESGLVMLSIW